MSSSEHHQNGGNDNSSSSNAGHGGGSGNNSNSGNNVTLRMIISGREVGVIIGRGGETINSIRQSSNCKIHISDGSVPERVITVVGQSENVYEAYSAMCDKLEAGEEGKGKEQHRKETLTLRLAVPAAQCGSLIGKGGVKIKEIRELSGANVNVASDMLPGSTERCVTCSGSKDSITQCIYHVCQVMAETPTKGNTVQYQPSRMPLFPPPGGRGGPQGGPDTGRHGGMGSGGHVGGPPGGPLMGGGTPGGNHALAALATLASSQIRRSDRDRDREVSQQMSVANEMIGSIIGKGGTKIAEIRQMSGANIQISKGTDKDASSERTIQITGYPDSVALAKSLINMSLDLHKMEKEQLGDDEEGGEGGDRRKDDRRHRNRNDYNSYGGAGGMGPEGMLANREVMQALNTLAHYNNITNGGLFGAAPGFGQMGGGGMNRGRGGFAGSVMSGAGAGASGRVREDDRKQNTRNKFSPY